MINEGGFFNKDESQRISKVKDIHATRTESLQARSTTYGKSPLRHPPTGRMMIDRDFFSQEGKDGMKYKLDTNILMK